MWWGYVASAVVVVFLLVLRALTSGVRPVRATAARPERGPQARPAPTTGAIAVEDRSDRVPVSS
jgi:hypothetical protein